MDMKELKQELEERITCLEQEQIRCQRDVTDCKGSEGEKPADISLSFVKGRVREAKRWLRKVSS